MTAVAQGKLIDAGADFLAYPYPVHVGDLVVNERDAQSLLTARVTSVSKTELTLSQHIFTAVGQRYRIFPGNVQVEGQATSVSTRKLVDSTKDFRAAGVRPDFLVLNKDTGEIAWVENVSSQELSLSRHIFTAAGQAYRVWQGDVVWAADVASLARRRVLIDADSTEVSTQSTVATKVKELLFLRHRSGYYPSSLTCLVEARVSSGQGFVSLRLNGTERALLSFASTSYEVKVATVTEGLPEGLVDLELWAYVGSSGAQMAVRLWEIFADIEDLE